MRPQSGGVKRTSSGARTLRTGGGGASPTGEGRLLASPIGKLFSVTADAVGKGGGRGWGGGDVPLNCEPPHRGSGGWRRQHRQRSQHALVKVKTTSLPARGDGPCQWSTGSPGEPAAAGHRHRGLSRPRPVLPAPSLPSPRHSIPAIASCILAAAVGPREGGGRYSTTERLLRVPCLRPTDTDRCPARRRCQGSGRMGGGHYQPGVACPKLTWGCTSRDRRRGGVMARPLCVGTLL